MSGRQVQGQVNSNGSGAGAYVGHHQLRRFHTHQRHKQGVLHHTFRFRAGNQHVGVDQQVYAVELFILEDVGQRFPLQAAFHNRGQSLFLLRRNLGFLLGKEVVTLHPHHVHQHHLGLQAGVGDVTRLQGAVGLLNGFAKKGHIIAQKAARSRP